MTRNTMITIDGKIAFMAMSPEWAITRLCRGGWDMICTATQGEVKMTHPNGRELLVHPLGAITSASRDHELSDDWFALLCAGQEI
jgi:hypothetical protein